MIRLLALSIRSLLFLAVAAVATAEDATFDVVIYGGSSAGVIAAVQAGRMGKSTLLISQTNHVGGMTASGLGTTDTGNAATIGGLAYAFYAAVDQYYRVTPPRLERANAGDSTVPPGVKFDFEPHVAEAVFLTMLRESRAQVWFADPLDREGGVMRDGRRIVSIRLKSGRVAYGRMFIDASYEGDLLATAGVRYRLGRESRWEYGETLAGVHLDVPLTGEVDPFPIPSDPTSGLLPGISIFDPGPDGAGDMRVQQYNLRLCLTDVPGNRVPITRPTNYNPADYELLRRRLQAHPTMPMTEVLKIQAIPNGKADLNATGSFSTDMAGDDSTRWSESSDEERASMLQHYQDYTAGLLWFLVNDPDVPAHLRTEAARWGLAADEFPDTAHWPWQLYVREARRLIGSYVITEHDCEQTVTVADSVALGSYSMDSHKVTLFVNANGQLATEGFFDTGVKPYPISYRALIPSPEDCENLLVPVCLSATHVAFNSIRMEPVYMMLGQSAATAAALAIDGETSVQNVDYARLARQLRSDGQILNWPTGALVPVPTEADEETEVTPLAETKHHFIRRLIR